MLGVLLGAYFSYMAGQYCSWLSLRHSIFSQVSLLTAFLDCESKEVKGEPYPLYRSLENKALELLYQGHDDAYGACHAISEQMEDLMRRIKAGQKGVLFDVSYYKTEWLKHLSSLKPNWLAFFSPRKSSCEVMSMYNSKEGEYMQKARSVYERNAINPIDAKTLFDE